VCGAALAEPRPAREQRKVVTVLFCDVTGSTALGERLDPESLRAVLARYFEGMKTIVERHGGTVEKFIGDAVMAVFGVPQLHEDDALRALRAASEMAAELPRLGVEGRIGVMTGEVVTGTEERLATGDAVNVAARLEQAAPPGEVLLGEATFRLTRDAIEAEPVEALTLRGKAEPVPAYRLIAVRGSDGILRHPESPMIGRSTELRRLRDALDQAVRDRSCQLFSILGAAGVGKSRLTAELVASLEGARVVRGRCLPYGDGITYWPVVEVIRQLSDVELEGEPGEALRSLLGQRAVPARAEEIAWGFRTLLERAADGPLVCVFDDVHWAEGTFLDLVDYVADMSREAPILLICMARPELLERRPSWGGGKLNSTTVLLEPLDADDTDRLLAGIGDLDDALRGRIREAAEGNPLFVEQMVALVRESPGHELIVPPTIQALLAARLDQLDVSERSVLEAGSVEGRLFHRGAVQALNPADGEVTARLADLVRKELVRPSRAELAGEEAYRFRHLLIRDAAYEALPKAARAELHATFAAWLETHGAGLVELDEILGYHLEQAHRYQTELGRRDAETDRIADRGRARLAAAGRRALVRRDSASAGLFERAVALLSEGSYDVMLERDLADALWVAGRPSDMEVAMESLGARAAASGDREAELTAQVIRQVARTYTGAARFDELEAVARAALPELEAADDALGLYCVWEAIATVEHGRLRNAAKLAACQKAVDQARRLGDERLWSQLSAYTANAYLFGPATVDETLAWLDSHDSSGMYELPIALVRGPTLAMAGRAAAARDICGAAYRRVVEQGSIVAAAICCSAAGEVEVTLGDAAAAERWLREACGRMEEMGHLAWLSTFAGQLGVVLCELERYEEADEWAEKGKMLGADDDVYTQILWRQARASVLAHRGDTDAAESLAREAVALASETDDINVQAGLANALAGILALSARMDEARDEVARAVALFEQKGNVVEAARARAALAERPELRE
jgi:class 3 adenylate cyclase/predicted ATPase